VEPERGAQVVFEKMAGEFLEGTVLERVGDRLRVQTHDGQASLNLTAAGVYPLGRAGLEGAPGSFAVCGMAPRRWEGCKVVTSHADQVRVVTPDDDSHVLTKGRVLRLSRLSQTNVERAFERAGKRRSFAGELGRFGAPLPPTDWRPHAGERVVALRQGQWHTAHVHEFEKDGAIRVRWHSDGEIERLERANIVPEPPYHRMLARGDFALLRPRAESRPWIAVKVRAVDAEGPGFKVEDINGERYQVPATALVPLGHP
jgi:hypothetical protein